MKRIGVLSDTHGTVPPQVYTFFNHCDELWHAGDMGRGVLEKLRAFKPIRAVYGNMDDYSQRYEVPETQLFNCDGLRVLMTHIGGWPGHYPPAILKLLQHDVCHAVNVPDVVDYALYGVDDLARGLLAAAV